MQMLNFTRRELPFFGRLVEMLDSYQDELIPLIELPYSLANFGKQMTLKQCFSTEQRATLVEVTTRQYTDATLEVPEQVNQLLDKNTFTVCTGHQLNLLTGPLYTIYKIAHTIKLADELSATYPNQRVLPIFWMATEDHDFEEINHFHVGDKKIQWHSNQRGAVGRMKLDNWSNWISDLKALFPNQQHLLLELFEAYQGNNLAQATLKLYQFLFRDTNLIILNGDDIALKKSFIPVMKKEIQEQFAIEATKKTAVTLEKKNLKEQAFAREINLFYLGNDERIRLEMTEERLIKIGHEQFTQAQILDLLHEHPEQFSPNVILRPVYQESVLPNICYIGGAGELSYWLQLKPVFDAVKVTYPILKLRVSMQIMSEKQKSKMEKLGFGFASFSQKRELVLHNLLKRLSDRTDQSDVLVDYLQKIETLLLNQAAHVDVTIVPSAKAEVKRIENLLKHFEAKLRRIERRKHADQLERATILHQSFFPNGILQERHENFINSYLETRGKLIEELLSNLDVHKAQFIVSVIKN